MPIYEFRCDGEDCKGKKFDEMCSYSKVEEKKVKCPSCNCSKNVVKLISRFNASFANPAESSRSDSFEYMARHNMERAKTERREAEAKSHVGANPHVEINDIENFGEGIFDPKS